MREFASVMEAAFELGWEGDCYGYEGESLDELVVREKEAETWLRESFQVTDLEDGSVEVSEQ